LPRTTIGLVSKRLLGLVDVPDEGLDPALVKQHLLKGLGPPQVAVADCHPGVEERQLAQPVLQRLAVELDAQERAVSGRTLPVRIEGMKVTLVPVSG
jgi:hypothetical protein